MSNYSKTRREEGLTNQSNPPSEYAYKGNQRDEPFLDWQISRSQYSYVEPDMLNHLNKITKRELNASPSPNHHCRRLNEVGHDERKCLNDKKILKSNQLQSYFNQFQPSNRGRLNDFSFDEANTSKTSHIKAQNIPRETAKKRELQIKMNNIESINAKIGDLLRLVKKERTEQKYYPNKEREYHQKSISNLKQSNSSFHNKSIDTCSNRFKEAKLTTFENEEITSELHEKRERRPKQNYKENQLSVEYNESQSKKYLLKMDDKPEYQRSRNQTLVKLQQNVYKSPLRNRNKCRNEGSVRTYLPKQENQIQPCVVKNKNDPPTTISKAPLQRQQQSTIKSIEQLLNERRMLKNKNTVNEQKQSEINVKQETSSQTNKRQVRKWIYQEEKQSQSSIAQSNRVDKKINERRYEYLLSEDKEKQSSYQDLKEQFHDKSAENRLQQINMNIVGKIYKKNTITPLRATNNYRNNLEISINN